MNFEKEVYIKLNNAIWERAIDDEIKCQKLRLFEDVTEKTFNVLLKYGKEKRNTFAKVERIVVGSYGAQGTELVKTLETIIDGHQKRLKKSVQNKIYRESLQWPNNRKGRKDPEYEKEYVCIVNDILKAFNAENVKEA